jgi:hypothetical protein
MQLVETYAQVVKNIARFNSSIAASPELQSKLSAFMHWYYSPEVDALAPARFVAYQDMDSGLYLSRQDAASSRQAMKWLRHWFKPAEEPELATLKNQLIIVTANFNRKPHKRVQIHEPINSIRLFKEPIFLH